jgi:hypothetical protein
MTLAANGAMSVGGNTFTRSINLELGRAFNTQGALGADFYSKFNVSLASITSGEPFEGNALAPGEPCEVSLNFASNGTWEASLEANGTATGNWATTADAGSTYHIRFTRTFFSGGFGNSATASTGWLPLNVSQGIQVFNSGNDSSVTADYTIEIATDSGGTNILDSASFITLNALLFGI